MTGLEKIIGRIEQDSAKACDDIVSAAKKQAEDIIVKAAADGAASVAHADEKARHQVKEMIRMAHSGAQQKAKQMILTAKIDAINETIAIAENMLKQMPAEEYFKSLSALARCNALQGQGEMRLSANDLERLPLSFEAEVNSLIKEKSAFVKISSQPAPIDAGFILVYGDIEINCTFDALLEANREELKEKICDIIF